MGETGCGKTALAAASVERVKYEYRLWGCRVQGIIIEIRVSPPVPR